MNKFIVNCECRYQGHTMAFEKIDGDLYIEFQLSQYLGFWSRLRSALKYTFQARGTVIWDEVMISPGQAQELKNFLEKP